jgi:ceramide glucosyltransferase
MRGARTSGWRYEPSFSHGVFLTAFGILSMAAAMWWTSSVAVLLLSFAASLAHSPRRRKPGGDECPLLTAIVPVKALHADFEGAQRSLFLEDYPGLEIIIAAREDDTPALRLVERIRQDFPRVASRLVRSRCDSAASPKLNTLWPAIGSAGTDLILTKDSNLHLDPGELADIVGCLGPDTGLVSTISIATNPGSFAAWIEASIINCYHARVLMLADAAGLGFGLGKVMLFRKSDLARAGGFDCLAWALGEDMALARAVTSLGLRTVMAPRVSRQPLGARKFREFWERQLRWMVVWRVQLPAAFLGDILGSAFPTAAAGAMAAGLFGLTPGPVAILTISAWFILEAALCAAKGWPLSLWSPLAFVARELVTPVLWLRACSTRDVSWAGAVYRAGRKPHICALATAQTARAVARNRDK